MVGVVLFFVVMAFAFTGYLRPSCKSAALNSRWRMSIGIARGLASGNRRSATRTCSENETSLDWLP